MTIPKTPPNSKYFALDKSDNKTVCFLIYLPKFGPVPVPVKDLVQGAEGRYWRGLIAAVAESDWTNELERIDNQEPVEPLDEWALQYEREMNAAAISRQKWYEWGRETEKESAL